MIRDLLAPLGAAYGLILKVRGVLYAKNIFKSVRLPKKVISIGNLTVGGTGKTPMVDYVVTQLEAEGKRVAVLTRGYGRSSSEALLLSTETPTSMGGDEPVWLKHRHPFAQIAVGADRVAAAKLIDSDEIDVYLLDDGFQHLRIQRDLEIVLVDGSKPLWHYHPLPWGLAREHCQALKRADLVVVTRTNQIDSFQKTKVFDFLRDHFSKPVVSSQIILLGVELLSLATRSGARSENLKIAGKKVAVVSGVGHPESVLQTVRENNATIVFEKRFTDHQTYSVADLEKVSEAAFKVGAELLLITEKDAVKWLDLLGLQPLALKLSVGVLKIGLQFNPELPRVYDLVSH